MASFFLQTLMIKCMESQWAMNQTMNHSTMAHKVKTPTIIVMTLIKTRIPTNNGNKIINNKVKMFLMLICLSNEKIEKENC